jgi:hypothetical protein
MTNYHTQIREKMQLLYRKWGYLWAHGHSLLMLFRTAPNFALSEKFVLAQLGPAPR